jgi:hypothetical protein
MRLLKEAKETTAGNMPSMAPRILFVETDCDCMDLPAIDEKSASRSARNYGTLQFLMSSPAT